jgi:hypothetical protein
MSSEIFESELHIPPPQGAKLSNYWDAITRLNRDHADHLRYLRDGYTKRESLIAQINEDVIRQVGSETWRKYRAFTMENRRTNHGLGAINLDRNGQARLEAARQESIASAQAILTDARVNIADLTRARESSRAKLRQLRSPRQAMAEKVPEADVPERFRNATEHNNPITKFPPYEAGWTWWHFFRVGGEDPTITFHLKSNAGQVGHRPVCINHDAGDNDSFNLNMHDQLGFWKDIPNTGTWDIWIKAVCISAKDYYFLENEWGWSDADNEMYTGITFSATTFPPVNLANDNPFGIGELWNSYVYGVPSDTKTYAHTWRNPGQVIWFHYKTPFTVPAGFSTLILVGTYASIDSSLNDTSVTLIMNNWWTIQQVSIDIL